MIKNDILYQIETSRCIAVVGHVMPDGDTLGSCLALGRALKSAGKKVNLFCQDSPPISFSYLNGVDWFQKPDGSSYSFDLVIALDCSDIERMGSCRMILGPNSKIINIDHHISNTLYGDINWVDPTASSTGELVYSLIKSLIQTLDIDMAEALYTAITTDTGSFCFSNTTSMTHRVTAEILECGIDVDRISALLFKSRTLAKTILLGAALNTLRMYFKNSVAVISITREMIHKSGAEDQDTEGIIDFAKEIDGVKLGILFKETENGCTKIGFRSKESIDVSVLAAKFGGGGHKRAAGCVINESIEKAENKVLEAFEAIYQEIAGP